MMTALNKVLSNKQAKGYFSLPQRDSCPFCMQTSKWMCNYWICKNKYVERL